MTFQLVAVTNRKQCAGPLPTRVSALLDAGINKVILREKDLNEGAFKQLLDETLSAISPDKRYLLTVNSFTEAAQAAGARSIQVPLAVLQQQPNLCEVFSEVGVSVHSVTEARQAEHLGASFLMAGHIFSTTCKPGLESRGLNFLHDICTAVSLPVFAIGGINEKTISATKDAGAAGACLMSRLMTCEKPAETILRLQNIVR
jgi:thiamine-phosphate pyrophosphorylase